LHVFTYSERENTLAAEMSGTVPGSTRAERSKMLHILSDKKRRAFYCSQLDRTAQVLFEGDIKDGFMHGFTRNYVKVKAKYDPILVNEIKKVYLTNISPDGDVEITESEEILTH
jgi:threonylcarbamoyladenosine tRNA methylthiotransferase MtaB